MVNSLSSSVLEYGLLPLADRATIANMAPEYGATCGFFPVDAEAIDYIRLTGRDEEHIKVVEAYAKNNGLFYTPDKEDPTYTKVVEINLADIEPNLSGPKRPQDLIPLSQMKQAFHDAINAPMGNQGFGLNEKELDKEVTVKLADGTETNNENWCYCNRCYHKLYKYI